MTKIISPSKAEKVLDLPGICGRMFHHSEGLELVELTIESGKSIAGHEMPIDVIFYLLEGELEFTVDNKKIKIKNSDVLEISAFSERAVVNSHSQVAKLLVIKKIK